MKRCLAVLILISALPLTVRAQEVTFPPELLAQMDALISATETLRKLPTLTPVDIAFPTRAETIAFLNELYNIELPDAENARLAAFYAALDLLPDDTDLRAMYLDLLGQQVAGFYDADTGVMNVIPVMGNDVGGGLSLLEQIIFVHEYTHALQDQHYGLAALLENPDVLDQPDRTLAVLSLVEGDATAIMQLYTEAALERNPLLALSLLTEGALAGGLTLPPGLPDILARELLFPYEDGLRFVQTLYADGGWDAIDAAYANPPTTSEQILHPDKYLSGEDAQPVTLPETAVLPQPWMIAWDTTLGQFYLREFLRMHLEPEDAERAADGWGGDAFRVWQHAAGQTAFVLRLRWDTLADQQQFSAVLQSYVDNRFFDQVSSGCWGDTHETLCYHDSAAFGSYLVSAPTVDLALALVARE